MTGDIDHLALVDVEAHTLESLIAAWVTFADLIEFDHAGLILKSFEEPLCIIDMNLSREHRLDKLIRIELTKVVDAFTNPDISDGNGARLCDRGDDTSFCGAIQFA